MDRFAAAIEAARLRLRPILMTSLALNFGVVPLVWAIGAGAELRQTLGTPSASSSRPRSMWCAGGDTI
jgi:multidrug efflux pump subunit AcrB